MSIVRDSFLLDASDPEFIRLEYTSLMRTAVGPVDEHKTFWFERASVPEIVANLPSLLGVEQAPTITIHRGADHISLYLLGPDPAPYVNFKNVRTSGAPHDGFQWFSMSSGLAAKLLEELASLTS